MTFRAPSNFYLTSKFLTFNRSQVRKQKIICYGWKLNLETRGINLETGCEFEKTVVNLQTSGDNLDTRIS